MKETLYHCAITEKEMAVIVAERLKRNKDPGISIGDLVRVSEDLLKAKRRKPSTVFLSTIITATINAGLIRLAPGTTSLHYSDELSRQLEFVPAHLPTHDTPSKKFTFVDIYGFGNNTQEEQEFCAKIKESIKERWRPGQLINWFDFWNWLDNYLEKPVRAGFVLDVTLLLFREKIIKHVGMSTYELV